VRVPFISRSISSVLVGRRVGVAAARSPSWTRRRTPRVRIETCTDFGRSPLRAGGRGLCFRLLIRRLTTSHLPGLRTAEWSRCVRRSPPDERAGATVQLRPLDRVRAARTRFHEGHQGLAGDPAAMAEGNDATTGRGRTAPQHRREAAHYAAKAEQLRRELGDRFLSPNATTHYRAERVRKWKQLSLHEHASPGPIYIAALTGWGSVGLASTSRAREHTRGMDN
jgi:hypothetical protein